MYGREFPVVGTASVPKRWALLPAWAAGRRVLARRRAIDVRFEDPRLQFRAGAGADWPRCGSVVSGARAAA